MPVLKVLFRMVFQLFLSVAPQAGCLLLASPGPLRTLLPGELSHGQDWWPPLHFGTWLSSESSASRSGGGRGVRLFTLASTWSLFAGDLKVIMAGWVPQNKSQLLPGGFLHDISESLDFRNCFSSG